MLLANKFIDRQIISLDEGRIVGEVKDFYIDQALENITGLYLGSEGLISRRPKLIRQETVQLYGADVLFVQKSGIVIEGDQLDAFEEAETWLRREDLQGRKIEAANGTAVGQVEDIIFDEGGQVLGFSLTKVTIKGPVAENQAIEREVLINPGSDETPMIIDLVKAGRQRWFFENR